MEWCVGPAEFECQLINEIISIAPKWLHLGLLISHLADLFAFLVFLRHQLPIPCGYLFHPFPLQQGLLLISPSLVAVELHHIIQNLKCHVGIHQN